MKFPPPPLMVRIGLMEYGTFAPTRAVQMLAGEGASFEIEGGDKK